MTDKPERLSDLFRCFQGVVPSIIATADRHGVPNVTYVSQVHYLDEKHVALSRQFFNKTSRNLGENPRASAELYDPVTMQAYRLRLRFLRSETSGPLFDTMAMRIAVIASHTGMEGVFRLIGADVFEVERVEKVAAFLQQSAATADGEEVSAIDGFRSEMRGLQLVSERINRARDLESLLDEVLDALELYFGFLHSMVLLYDDTLDKLVTVATRGYGETSGVGAEVAVAQGLIGTVAREKRILRISGLEASLRYSRAVRRQVEDSGSKVRPEIPLPGHPNAQSAISMPLLIGDRLLGVIAAESRDPVRFDEWDEAYLAVIGNQIALGIDRMMQDVDDDAPPPQPKPA
ncbi:MAG TPA: GAF domain-containing protein, partial [Thermoanaerobaculia bacterium]